MADNDIDVPEGTVPEEPTPRDTNRQVAEDLLVRLRTTHGRDATARDVTDAIVAVGHALLAVERRLGEHREALEMLRDRLDEPK